MKRRDFLQYAAALTTHTVLTSALAETFFLPSAYGQQVPVDSLRQLLPTNEALILIPADHQFATYQPAFNKRTMLTPSVRVLCSTPNAVAICIQWAQQNQVPLGMRCGGHSFEGLSQTMGLAIDTRPMNLISISQLGDTVTVGGGCTLGNIYAALAQRKLALPAGSCPSVGIVGHTTGGGYGLLARPLGLACDSLIRLQMVNANGEILNLSETENADLFWACRGGGGGSFGVITQLQFRTHAISTAIIFGASWKLKSNAAAQLMRTWQQWAPNAPKEITSLMKVSKDGAGYIHIRCIGQSIGTEQTLRHELSTLSDILPPDSLSVQSMDLIDAIKHFAGSDPSMPSVFMKGKSDYISQMMTPEAVDLFLEKIPASLVDVIFDSYGGAISDVAADASAFVHRAGTFSSLQYYTEWPNAINTEYRLNIMRTFYEAMRPLMSGGAYLNYCDLDLKDFATSYWGSNLDRLKEIKTLHDPTNLFRHAQSVPLKTS